MNIEAFKQQTTREERRRKIKIKIIKKNKK